MKTEIKDGNLTIIIPMNPTPVRSASGKTLVVASSYGAVPTAEQIDGKPVKVNVTAWIAR